MKKRLCFVIALMGLAVFWVPAEAATVKGRVLDQITRDGPTDWAKVDVFKKDAQGDWIPETSGWVYNANPAFTFSSLAEGAYSFLFSGGGYVSEYYNNTTLTDNRTEVTLAADDTVNLGRIYLRPLPIRIANARMPNTTVPAGGGKIKILFDIINETGKTKSIFVWVNARASRVLYRETSVNSEFTAGSRLVEVPAESSVPASVVITVPADAPAADLDVYLSAGDGSKWKPLHPYGYVGAFTKLAP